MEHISIWKQVQVLMVIVLVSSVHSTVNHQKCVHLHSGKFSIFFHLIFFIFVFFLRYHMFGSTIDTLNIYVRAGGIDTLIWSLKGNQGDEGNVLYIEFPFNDIFCF